LGTLSSPQDGEIIYANWLHTFFPSAAKQQQDGGYSSFAGSALTGTTKEQKEGAPKINGAPPYGWE
jgi:hypothetical protein